MQKPTDADTAPKARSPLADYLGEGATGYEARRSANPKWLFEDESLARVLAANPDLSSVIDAPVGTGRFLDLYQRLLPDAVIHAIDYSDDMLAIARGRTTSARVHFRKQDIVNQALGVDADLVVCYRFLNLFAWREAAATLANVFRAARKLAVFAIRTIDDAYQGERVIENKIHLHRRADLDALCAANGFAIINVDRLDTARAGDYCIVTCAPVRHWRESRINKNLKMVFTYGRPDTEGKVYEVKDRAHARFIEAITNESPLRDWFPRVRRIDDRFIDAAWVPGERIAVASWPQLLKMLVAIQSLECALESSFDYVEDLVIPRFHKALPVVGRDLFDRVVATIRERAADFEPAVSHPDITAANVIVSGEAPIIIDNELLCRSRHHRIDILNLLHNLDAVDRPRAFASYLDLAAVTPGEWHRHTDYLRHLWLARQVGSDVRRNDLAGAQARVRTFVAGDNILPIDPAGPLAEPPDGRP